MKPLLLHQKPRLLAEIHRFSRRAVRARFGKQRTGRCPITRASPGNLGENGLPVLLFYQSAFYNAFLNMGKYVHFVQVANRESEMKPLL